jgi:PAS domain S-box-containing protein
MDDKPLYNSRVIITFLEYLRQTRPDLDQDELLADSGISRYEVEDEGHWLTQRQVDGFHDALIARTQDPSIFRAAGRFMASSKSVSAIRQFVLGFLSPIQAYAMLGKIAPYVNRGTTFFTRKIKRNQVEIITRIAEGVNEKPYQCENRMGSLEAVALPFINKLPVMEHPVCVHRGGPHCQYLISWEEPTYLILRRIRNALVLPLLCSLVASGILLSPLLLAVHSLLALSVIFGLSFYAEYIEKREIYAKIEDQGATANRLLDQITISYNNALMVQEIGQAVSSILEIDRLMQYIIETLQKRLDFDRGMIMLANPGETRLVYVNGYGYSPDLEMLLKNTQFHLDKPQSRGPFVTAFKRQSPILVNDVKDLRSDISTRSANFVDMLGVRSFICVPIVYEGRSLGILAVDNYRSNRPHNQSEVSLLMGIAPQIAISINNAKAIRRIMESEERFRTLNENSPDIIYTTDNTGIVTYVNPAATEIMGYAKEALIGRHFSDFVHQDHSGKVAHAFERVKQGKETIKNFEALLIARDGSAHLFDMSGAPNLNASGEMTGIVGTLKDFTAQRKLERQLSQTSKMNALGRLTGGIAHDFNNILQAISAYTQLLTIRKTENDPDWKYLTNISGLTRRATDLITQLLLFSSQVESTLMPIDINREIRIYFELLVSTLPKTITMKLDLAEDLRLINGDTAQLGQVIMNLAVNAKDAMPKGGELCLQTRDIELATPQDRENATIRAGHYTLFRISDTGCGIDREDLEHIFEPFFTTKEAGKGTGIGLSVVYGIIKNHNGYIFCNSEAGKGTIFEIYFPTLDTPVAQHVKEEPPDAGLSEGHETILLVDDEPSLLETGQELLSFLGYHVLTATSGEEALTIVNREGMKIGIVIMDLMMPGMGGEKCLAEILKVFPAMKVMFASGYAASIGNEDILRTGAVAFIQKPYYIEDMSRKIREILDGSGQPS